MVLMFVLYCNLGNILLTQFARVEISRRIRIFEATCYAITANHTIMELYLLIRRALKKMPLVHKAKRFPDHLRQLNREVSYTVSLVSIFSSSKWVPRINFNQLVCWINQIYLGVVRCIKPKLPI